MSRESRVAVACAAIAVALCSVAVGFSLHSQDWRVSALVRMDNEDEIAPFAYRHERGFAFTPEGHYDGVYFYAMTIDPLARGVTHELIDHAAYRYGHVGYSWIAWTISFGDPRRVPGALLVIALIGAGLAGYTASRIAGRLGWSPWGGLAVALQPGLIYSVTVLTSEAVGFAVVGFALLFWLEERHWPALGLMALGVLVKEPFVLVPIALMAWELFRRRKEMWNRILLLGVTALPAVVWHIYIYKVFGVTSFEDTASPIEFPFGWVEAMKEAAHMGVEAYERTQIGTIALPILVIAFGLFFAGVVKAVRLRSILDPIYILQAVVVIALSPAALTYPKDFFRTTVVPLALVVPVVFSDKRLRRGDERLVESVDAGRSP